MAILHADNFFRYGNGGQARLTNGVYAAAPGVELQNDPDPNAPAGSIAARIFANFFQAGMRYVLPGQRTKVAILGRLWMPSLPSQDITINGNGDSPTLNWISASNVGICALVVRPTGAIALVNSASNSTQVLAQTDGPVLTANAYWHIEAECDFSDINTVAFEIRVEGVPVLSGSAAVTNPDKPAQVMWGASGLTNNRIDFWKDLVVRDGVGPNNATFLGPVMVISTIPNIDVDKNWTPAIPGPNYAMVDNSPPVDDTQFITAGNPAPSPDRYGMTSLPIDVTAVKAVITSVRARKTDGGDGNIQAGLVSDGSAGVGQNRPITTAFTYYSDVFEIDPATGQPWLPSAVNDAEIQVNRTL